MNPRIAGSSRTLHWWLWWNNCGQGLFHGTPCNTKFDGLYWYSLDSPRIFQKFSWHHDTFQYDHLDLFCQKKKNLSWGYPPTYSDFWWSARFWALVILVFPPLLVDIPSGWFDDKLLKKVWIVPMVVPTLWNLVISHQSFVNHFVWDKDSSLIISIPICYEEFKG